MLQKFLNRWRRPRISSGADFLAFLNANAWLVTQKTVIGYCTVKTKLPVHELLDEAQFAEAYDISIREAHAAVLADLMEIGLGYVRPHASGRETKLSSRLAEGYDALLNEQPMPAHRAEQGWEEEIAAVRRRLDMALNAPARPIRDVSTASAERIFATLPIHERLRDPDSPAIVANVQFLMVGLAHEFSGRIDLPAVAEDLAA